MIIHSSRLILHAPAQPPPKPPAPAQPPLEHASPLTKARRLWRELRLWRKAGAQLVPREARLARLAICQPCPYYNAAGNLGLGECRYPGCGCTRVKAALATSKCPAGKWPIYTPSGAP